MNAPSRQRNTRRRGRGRWIVLVLTPLLAGCLLITIGARDVTRDFATEAKYERLRREAQDGDRHDDDSTGGTGEWSGNAAAWLTVRGTPIDYPVAQATSADPEFYLSHDLWGEESRVGCPFIDWRCSVESTHTVIYAHHVGTTDLQFSPIADSWRQQRFDELSRATLSTGNSAWEFVPLCALVVDKQFAPIQQFSFASEPFTPWLESLVREADALAPDAPKLCAKAEKALTLVTCASQQGGQRERTLLVLVSLRD